MRGLEHSLQKVTKALVLRNSRFAEEVLREELLSGESGMMWHHIRSIAELTLRINEEPQLKAYEDLASLADAVILMLSTSENRLKEVMEIYDRISRDIQAMMKKTPNNVNRGVNLILLANHYVQIAQCLCLT